MVVADPSKTLSHSTNVVFNPARHIALQTGKNARGRRPRTSCCRWRRSPVSESPRTRSLWEVSAWSHRVGEAARILLIEYPSTPPGFTLSLASPRSVVTPSRQTMITESVPCAPVPRLGLQEVAVAGRRHHRQHPDLDPALGWGAWMRVGTRGGGGCFPPTNTKQQTTLTNKQTIGKQPTRCDGLPGIPRPPSLIRVPRRPSSGSRPDHPLPHRPPPPPPGRPTPSLGGEPSIPRRHRDQATACLGPPSSPWGCTGPSASSSPAPSPLFNIRRYDDARR